MLPHRTNHAVSWPERRVDAPASCISNVDIDTASRIHPTVASRQSRDDEEKSPTSWPLTFPHPTPHTPGLVAKPTTRFGRKAVVVRADADATNWIKKDPTVLMASAAGWFIPSNIGVGAFGGKSLFGLFTASIGENMAHFPTGPALDDKFWLYMVTWHVGLFVTMTLGQIGFQGRKQGCW